MFGLFEGLTKAAVATVSLPVTIAVDVVTLGGSLTGKAQPYTAVAASAIMKNLENSFKAER